MKTVRVELADKSYDVTIAAGLIDSLGENARAVCDGRAAFIITDSNVGPLYAARAAASLTRAGFATHTATFLAGESHKNLATVSAIFDEIFAAPTPPDRSSLIVALGGGVVGDVAGFTAAILLRGVPFIQAPTTLLADVDSSIGGKTGVDHAAGKNLIGAFHQPKAVYIDPAALQTLPPIEIAAGLAECIKTGIIRDAELIDWIEAHADGLRGGDSAAFAELIERNVAIKAAVVSEDQFERDKGPRSHLNFGHTIGHAIEAERGFGGGVKPLSLEGRGQPKVPGLPCKALAKQGEGKIDYMRHGHCISLGMVAAMHIAVGKNLLSAGDAARIEESFSAVRSARASFRA